MESPEPLQPQDPKAFIKRAQDCDLKRTKQKQLDLQISNLLRHLMFFVIQKGVISKLNEEVDRKSTSDK